jgi:hypothetical protein
MKQALAKPHTIFLIDALGAVLSLIFLLVIYFNEPVFGMPQSVVQTFYWIALGLAVYSTLAYFSRSKAWRFSLRLLAILNFGYGLLTLVFVIREFSQLTWLGIGYFSAELTVILILATYEFRLASRAS